MMDGWMDGWMDGFCVRRYRKMSTRIHPDKLRDVEEPRIAFEEVSYVLPHTQ
jgi:hypothetical protein